jgi:hypothetical protein
MKSLKYICVQPRLYYYAWQVEVMLENFLRNNIKPSDIDILVAWNLHDLTNTQEHVLPWFKLKNKYKNISFHFYQDTRINPHYISSVRPNILKQHFTAFPELKDKVIFYHDCDIVFTKKPNIEKFLHNSVWYLSNTNSYINYDYIISKGHDVYNKMCEIVGIDPIIPKLMNSNSGGAQYIMKNIDDSFWEKVEHDSEELFKQITELNNKKKLDNPTYHELQIWCADMWAVLWNAWLRGNETKVVPELDFCWATDTINRWEETSIFHNAGVTPDRKDLFFKSDYINSSPYHMENKFSSKYCSYNYFNEILKTKETSCLI